MVIVQDRLSMFHHQKSILNKYSLGLLTNEDIRHLIVAKDAFH